VGKSYPERRISARIQENYPKGGQAMTSYQLRIVKREWDPARKAKASHSLITKPLSEAQARQLVELFKSSELFKSAALIEAEVKEGRMA
jgi:hypothetical protein